MEPCPDGWSAYLLRVAWTVVSPSKDACDFSIETPLASSMPFSFEWHKNDATPFQGIQALARGKKVRCGQYFIWESMPIGGCTP
eukprot:scaffold73_cov337-Pavlova_lutheri.AAC.76